MISSIFYTIYIVVRQHVNIMMWLGYNVGIYTVIIYSKNNAKLYEEYFFLNIHFISRKLLKLLKHIFE